MMSKIGNLLQLQSYQSKETYPLLASEWEDQARNLLEDGPFYYVAGGAGEQTMKDNLEAFHSVKIHPRMLKNVEERDLSVHLFGHTFPFPFMLAPIGVQSIVHNEGELASARAAARTGVPYIASSASSFPMEEIAAVMGDAPRWYQLYWGKNKEVTKSMLKRAEQSGYSALVVTLDTPLLGWREQDLKNKYLPFMQGIGIANYLSDPAFRAELDTTPEEDMESAIRYFFSIFSNATLTWDDIAFLRENSNLPIILKGILHPEDAELALKYGVDGIIVSNHGGRQVNGSVAALDALPEVCRVIQDRIPVFMDSGIRRGSDILKAIALGAKAVLLGRPYVYGLTVAGEVGVKQVINNLIADLDLTMALSGCKSISKIDEALLGMQKDKRVKVTE